MLQTYMVDKIKKEYHMETYNKQAKRISIIPITIIFLIILSIISYYVFIIGFGCISNFVLNHSPFYLIKLIAMLIFYIFLIIGFFLIIKKVKPHKCYVEPNRENEIIILEDKQLTHTYTINNIPHKITIPYKYIHKTLKAKQFHSFIILSHRIEETINEKTTYKPEHNIPLYFQNSKELRKQLKELITENNKKAKHETMISIEDFE